MEQCNNPFAPDFKTLPESLPVFPLASAFLLPTGQLPLNIFEDRYVQMVEDAMRDNRLIGMILPREDQAENETPELEKTGCAGKIIDFSETPDGRYLITLAGIYRFNVAEELSSNKLYRTVKPDWESYNKDAKAFSCLGLDRDKLKSLLKNYFVQHEMDCSWQAVDDAPDGKLITCLAMVCPFEHQEKQALLEAPCCKTRAEMFMSMLEIAVSSGKAPLPKNCH